MKETNEMNEIPKTSSEVNEIPNTSLKENLIRLIKKDKHRFYLSVVIIFFLGILLIFSTYAWFSTSLNVRVKTFNMIVTRNSGLSISFDAINYERAIEISEDVLINKLVDTYPNNLSQWAANGLVPVSSPGITNNNSYFFDIYSSAGVKYKNKDLTDGFVTTVLTRETKRRAFNNFIAFDLFLKNETGSPISDNLYLERDTAFVMTSESTDEMVGLVNSARIGFVKVGSVPLDTPVDIIQNLQCNNDCQSIIYEPNSTNHSELSSERAKKFGINLRDGREFPTYAYIKAGGPFEIADTISGSVALDYNYFKLQETISGDEAFDRPLFPIPNGITKVRVYVWLEGQDIDSLETDSQGADVSISISFVKDTQGYIEYE